jgi:hypothetical protein
MLTVPKPTFQFEPAGSGAAPMEKPVTVLVSAVKDGPAVLGPDKLETFGFFAYRRLASGSGLEVWDEGAKAWKPDPGETLATLEPVQLGFKEGEASPWSGIVVAAGGKDGAGNPQYAKARFGYPIYSFRALFSPKDSPGAVLGPPSDNLTFLSISDTNLFLVGPGEDEKPESATESRLILRSASLQTIGQVRIERAAPGARLTIENAAGASVVLHPDGRIELKPASGRAVFISGDLEAQRITYQPGGGGGRITL